MHVFSKNSTEGLATKKLHDRTFPGDSILSKIFQSFPLLNRGDQFSWELKKKSAGKKPVGQAPPPQ